jgi:prepilin-type processing-associated H-X9-DG protein
VNDLKQGLLWNYNQSAAIYRCASEKPYPINGRPVLRIRSYSLNGRMNGADVYAQSWGPNKKFTLFRKYADINLPGPAQALTFLDENPVTIDDGYFAIPVGENRWQNSPAVRHGRGSNLSFADGHAEYWRWVDPTTPKINKLDFTVPPGNRDLKRMEDAIAQDPNKP